MHLCASLSSSDSIRLDYVTGRRSRPFIRRVMLPSPSYRHQIESDIEPFRGLVDGAVLSRRWNVARSFRGRGRMTALLSMLVAFAVTKGAVVYAVACLFGSSGHQAAHRTSMFLQGAGRQTSGHSMGRQPKGDGDDVGTRWNGDGTGRAAGVSHHRGGSRLGPQAAAPAASPTAPLRLCFTKLGV